MSRFESERAILIRAAAGVQGLQEPRAIAWAIAESLGAAVRIDTALHHVPECLVRRDGSARITIPLVSSELVEALILLEELGHYLCQGPFPDPPAVHPLFASPGEIRAAQLWERILEGEVGRFVLEAVLPTAELVKLRNEADWFEALESTGLEWGLARERFQAALREPAMFPLDPPFWSAWRHFRLDWYGAPYSSRFLILSRERVGPAFEVACRPSEREATEHRIFLDLAALTPVEFGLKYGGDRSPAGESCFLAWQHLRERLVVRR